MLAYLFAIGTVFTTIIGGALAIKHKNRLHLFISFTAGVVLSVAFLEVLHELFEVVNEAQLNLQFYLLLVLGGFLIFHAVEKLITFHDAHDDDYVPHHHPITGYLTAAALIGHSFLDGLGIGLGFQLGTAHGIVIAVAVLAHDFSDGINTASIMMFNKLSLSKTKLIIFIDAIVPLLGVFLASRIKVSSGMLATYLAIFAGFLIYIGAGALLPEAHSKEKASKVLPLMLAGAVFGSIMTYLTSH